MTTFTQFAKRWEDSILPLKKPATRATMSGHLRDFERAFGDIPVQSLDNYQVQTYITSLATKLSAKTVKNRWSTLRVLLGRAKKEGLITQIPEPELPKVFKTAQDYLTISDLYKLVEEAQEPFKTLYRTFYETGLRIGEVLALVPADIDFENRTLTVNRSMYGLRFQTPKTPGSIRTLSISPELTEALSRMSDQNTVFETLRGKPWRQEKALLRLHVNLKMAGLHQMGYHSFRRGNATTLAGMGCPEAVISQRLGHTPKGLTMSTYNQERLDDRSWADRLGVDIFKKGVV